MKNTKKLRTVLVCIVGFAIVIFFSIHSSTNLVDENFNSKKLSKAPYKWNVKRVVDGDTLEILESFIPSELKLFVRLKNVDTPEKFPRAKCDKENELAQKAFKFTKNAIDLAKKNNQEIIFSELEWDKYGGRILSEVTINNRSLSQELIKNRLGREYYGKKKESWCN